MSEVFSFRLDKNKQREAQALVVIQAWKEEGYEIRYIITKALMSLNATKKDKEVSVPVTVLNETLHQVNQLIERIENGNHKSFILREEGRSQKVTEVFISSVKEIAKPGLNLD